ncbi:MAG: M6 family metalloprotease domain-containing protein, partial [Porphyromonadaceae bacterium]
MNFFIYKRMKIQRALLTGLLLVSIFLNSEAAYLKNVPQKRGQPDGKILNCFATGDEYFNWLHDANNFTIIQDSVTGYYVYAQKSGTKLVPTTLVAGVSDPASAGLQPGLSLDPDEIRSLRKERFKIPDLKGSAKIGTTGTINNIVIFIRFSDQSEYTTNLADYNSDLNASGNASMVRYFQEVSKTQLTINTSFFPTSSNTVVSYQDTHARNYYCKYNATTNTIGYSTEAESTIREMTLLKNATIAVRGQIESTSLDFDNDNDGYVDNVCYIIQGATEGWSDLLWPHMWALNTDDIQIAGARVRLYNFHLSQSFGVSVACHEMSHSLGFPDLYRYTDRSITPVGPWDLMSWNSNPPQHQTVYIKQKYGQWFSNIPEITSSGTYSLAPLSTDAFAGYKIMSPNSTSEYFMLEYRKGAGLFESGLSRLGSGLIIYRVTPSLRGNAPGPPDEVYVYRPNGTITADGNINAAYFSSESGNTSFNATSNPSCFLSDGSPGGIEISNIGSAGPTISFTVNLSSTTPILYATPDSRTVDVVGGTTTFAVSNKGMGTMAWHASVISGSGWCQITSGSSGSNSGNINCSFTENTDQ